MSNTKIPDKIYRHQTTGDLRLNGMYHEYKPAKIRYDDEIIEYIRKDNLSECKTLKLIPSSSSIEEASEEYAPDFSDSIASKAAVDAVRDAFKAGAQWQREQMEKKRSIEY